MAIDDDTKSCSSRAIAAAESSPAAMAMAPRAVKHQMLKLDVYNDVLRRLQDWDFEEASVVGFEDQLWQHFNRLPARYALDVNVERAEDVLMHMRFLRQALDPANRPVFEVRLVQVNPISNSSPSDSVDSFSFGNDGSHRSIKKARSLSLHPPPTFGSSQNLEALALQSSETNSEDGYFTDDTDFDIGRAMHEITFSTVDKPKLLNQCTGSKVQYTRSKGCSAATSTCPKYVHLHLTSLLSDIGLNIQEAHAFSTIDGFSLDVFVVDGWPIKETEQLRILLDKELRKTKKLTQLEQSTSVDKECKEGFQNLTDVGNRSKSKGGEQEIDPGLLKLGNKVGSGTSGDLYKGTYNEQEVAIKILKADRVNKDVLKEFFQEVNILRKIRHKNIVQFSGACTQPPNLCIVTEFMARGNVYNFLHKQRGVFKLPSLIRAAIDVSQGMEYLDQNNIVHRDLKSANLLMTEDGVIKIADFGIARVHSHTGVMTAETGTYRWMAPEVIEHKPYDHKADVFSFGIVLWELLTGELPYAHLTPLQAAVGVVQKGLRPAIPKNTNPKLVDLLTECWHQDPAARPNFSQMIKTLHEIADVISQR